MNKEFFKKLSELCERIEKNDADYKEIEAGNNLEELFEMMFSGKIDLEKKVVLIKKLRTFFNEENNNYIKIDFNALKTKISECDSLAGLQELQDGRWAMQFQDPEQFYNLVKLIAAKKEELSKRRDNI